MPTERFQFTGEGGHQLAAALDTPDGPVQAYALFAHCFTCGKDVLAAKRIATALAAKGIAVLRFDFTGLGASADEIGDVGREGRICKFAFACAEAGKVETQYRNPFGGQRSRDAFRRQHVLAAGEAMRKQRVGLHRSIRRIQRGGKLMAAFAGELEAFSRHGRSPQSMLRA